MMEQQLHRVLDYFACFRCLEEETEDVSADKSSSDL